MFKNGSEHAEEALRYPHKFILFSIKWFQFKLLMLCSGINTTMKVIYCLSCMLEFSKEVPE